MSSEGHTVRFADVPKGRLLIWLIVAGEIVIFGGGIVAFLLHRIRYPDLFDQLASLTSTRLGALNTLVLLTSSLLIILAHHFASKRELGKMKMAMLGTIGLGAVFLVLKSLEWIPKISNGVKLGIDDPQVLKALAGVGVNFWNYYYFLTGMHAVHVILGMLTIFIVMMNVRKGENLHRVEMIGIYWHFVDLVWIFLFPLFYLSR